MSIDSYLCQVDSLTQFNFLERLRKKICIVSGDMLMLELDKFMKEYILGNVLLNVIFAGLEIPTSIAVDPQLGRTFWADAGSAPKIEVSWMDGPKRRPLITEAIRHRVAITIDYSHDHTVFRVDSKLNIIESMRPDGTQRKAIIKGEQLRHPVSLDMFESNLYWVTRDTGELVRQDKFGRGFPVVVHGNLLNPSGIKIYHESGGRRCACPDYSGPPQSHRYTADLICDAAAERPRPPPRICPCENSGLCVEDSGNLVCDCLPNFSGDRCEQALGHTGGPSNTNVAAIVVPIMVIILVLLAAGGVWYIIRKKPFGKMARLSSLTSSSSVSFHQNANVEFNSTVFPNAPPPPNDAAPPMEGYNLQTVNSGKRDFSNPMYDAVQSGTITDPSLENGAGVFDVGSDGQKMRPVQAVGPFPEPSSAILARSSITHKLSPKLKLRTRRLDPTEDTGKDTQNLVEEDQSEC